MARHVASSLDKGDRVIVSGRLTRREYEAKNEDGTTGTRYQTEIDVEELGASLRWNSWQKVETRPLNQVAEPAAAGKGEMDDDGDGEGASSEAADRVVAPAA
jgi:single-strand DNA-binding protein